VKKLVLSLSDVPATGRTTLCEILQAVWRRKSLAHSRYHTSTEQPLGPGRSRFVDLTNGLNCDDVISWLDATSLVMLDVATGDAAYVADDYSNSDLPEMLAEVDCSITLLAIHNGQPRAESELLWLAERFRDDAEYVVVRHEGAARPAGGWHLAACQRAMHHLGAVPVELPAWPAPLSTFAREERLHALTLLARQPTWSRPVQTWIENWLLAAQSVLEAAADSLWPAELDRPQAEESDYTACSPARRGRRRGTRRTSSAV